MLTRSRTSIEVTEKHTSGNRERIPIVKAFSQVPSRKLAHSGWDAAFSGLSVVNESQRSHTSAAK